MDSIAGISQQMLGAISALFMTILSFSQTGHQCIWLFSLPLGTI